MKSAADHRFYVYRAGPSAAPLVPPDGIQWDVWRPSPLSVPPRAIRSTVNWIWWGFHNLRLFRNRDFAIVMLRRGDRVVHASTIMPRYFRFPFMADADLQIGATWTEPAERGRGLAGFAIDVALQTCHRPGRVFWYVVEDSNVASIRVIEKKNFTLAGRGRRLPRAGLRVLGYFAMTDP